MNELHFWNEVIDRIKSRDYVKTGEKLPVEVQPSSLKLDKNASFT